MFFSLNPNHSQSGSTFATEQMFEELKFAVPEKQLDVEIGNDVEKVAEKRRGHRKSGRAVVASIILEQVLRPIPLLSTSF